MRELVEASGVDGWLEGPNWGAGINQQQLIALLAQMQGQRRMAGECTSARRPPARPTAPRLFFTAAAPAAAPHPVPSRLGVLVWPWLPASHNNAVLLPPPPPAPVPGVCPLQPP